MAEEQRAPRGRDRDRNREEKVDDGMIEKLVAVNRVSNSIVVYLLVVSVISIVSVILLPGGWGRKGAASQLLRDEAGSARPASAVTTLPNTDSAESLRVLDK